jgi:hypothetical protein
VGTGNEIWHVEGVKDACVWGGDDIRMALQELGWWSHDLAQDRKGGGSFKINWYIFGCYTMREIHEQAEKLLGLQESLYCLEIYGQLLIYESLRKKNI